MNTKTPQEILLEFDQEPNNEYKNIFSKSTVIKAMEAYHAQFEQVGMKWVKASERLPEKERMYFVKSDIAVIKAAFYFNGHHFETGQLISLQDELEWLDESPEQVEQKEGEVLQKAVEIIKVWHNIHCLNTGGDSKDF